MRNEMGFDPEKKYAPVHVDAFDNAQLFGKESFDVIIDLDLLKYTEYFLVSEFVKRDMNSPLFDFSLLQEVDEEAFFAILYFRKTKNPIKCFLRPDVDLSDEELDTIWEEFKLQNKDRIFNYVRTSLYETLSGLAVNNYVGRIYIWDDELDPDAQTVTEGEFREHFYFRQDKIRFIFTEHKDIYKLYQDSPGLFNKTRIFIIDGLLSITQLIENEPSVDFYAGKSFVVPARAWNIRVDEVMGMGKVNRYNYDADILSIQKGIDLKSFKLFNISKDEIAVG